MRVVAGILGLLGVLVPGILNAAAGDEASIKVLARHPWRPPFGTDRVGTPLEVVVHLKMPPCTLLGYADGAVAFERGIDAEETRVEMPHFVSHAVLVRKAGGASSTLAEIDIPLHAIDAFATGRGDDALALGCILPPADWVVVGPNGSVRVTVAACSTAEAPLQARVRAWYEHAPEIQVADVLELSRSRVSTELALPTPPLDQPSSRILVALENNEGEQLWQQAIPAMLVTEAPAFPVFGATALKLRYDPDISLLDRDTGKLSFLPYAGGWPEALEDVVVTLPTGSKFVFWRGTSYVPFWAGANNTGLSYEWAETTPPPDGFVDAVEPLMDKELRYGRVEIIESTAARVHVRWTYQSTDFNYKVWGDAAQEDFYFYPDGYGTRVLTLKSGPDSDYELSEFIVLAPQGAFPFQLGLPPIRVLDLQGGSAEMPLPRPEPFAAGQSPTPPLVYSVGLGNGDMRRAIYFNPRDKLPHSVLHQFGPFFDKGQIVTPAYWGSHWPLSRGKTTGGAIDDRIHLSPSHNSLVTWARKRPAPVWEQRGMMIDALGQSREMQVQQWVWLIGYTDANDRTVLDMARSFSQPPALEVQGARLEVESYSEARRAIRLRVEGRELTLRLTPMPVCVNPVFELADAPAGAITVTLNGTELPPEQYAWDGNTLWIGATLNQPGLLSFRWH